MTKAHLDDILLLKYLNKKCSKREILIIESHLLSCKRCHENKELHEKLACLLENNAPLLEPSNDFSDHVMRALSSNPNVVSIHSLAHKAGRRTARWKMEFIHGMAATAGTYLFITSGMMRKIVNLDAFRIGYEVQEKVAAGLVYGTDFINEVSDSIVKLFA